MAAVKLGVLGCASIAKKVSRAALLAGSAVELFAVASRSLAKAQEFAVANNFPAGAKTYGSYEELLDDADVDAVYIPLPTSLHLEWVLKAADKKKHILLEKPLALNVQELQKMFEACEKNGVQLMDGTMWMHNARTPRMEKDLRDPEIIGDIKEIRSVFSFPAQILFPAFLKENIRVKADLDSLGALGDIGWYCIRASLWAVGYEMPETVVALPGAQLNDAGVILSCSARLVWKDGKVATFSCSFTSFMTIEMVVQGTAGALVCEDFVVPLDDAVSPYTLHSNGHFLPLDLSWHRDSKQVVVENPIPQEASMVREFARLVSGIKKGDVQPQLKWHEVAMKTQVVVNAVKDSIDAGFSPVTIK